ncbi:hypothetical protein THIOM_000544 [Candidatus Thiomargarita nelsonii]|uniref:Uncharacterized protein n=1 Tax=Candidatus Thiomargarita nelsonii TaxID=1003181 RepID=A0A176S6U2_9GAMM|nr:hypothetical protein THIOM_000544 [Candidatus Thiomargarita nelsonii]
MPISENGLLLETLLLTPCLLPGNRSFKESKASITVQPQHDETILFFSIDDNSNPDCRLRQRLWGKRAGEELCDLIVFYARGSERVLCFVELKDNIKDLGHATAQVTNTYTHFKQHLRLNNYYTAKTFISAFAGSLPQEHQKYHRKLLTVFKGENNVESNGKPDELGDFLRGVKRKRKGKRRKR